MFSVFNVSMINNRHLKFNDIRLTHVNPLFVIAVLITIIVLLKCHLKSASSFDQKHGNLQQFA